MTISTIKTLNKSLTQGNIAFSKNSIPLTIEDLVQEFAKNEQLKSNYQILVQNSRLSDEQLTEKLDTFLKDQNLWHNYLFISNQLDSNKLIFDSKFRTKVNNLIKLYFLSVFYKKNHPKDSSQFLFYESFKSSKKTTKNIFKLENFKKIFDEMLGYQSKNRDTSLSSPQISLFDRISRSQLSSDTDKLLIHRVYKFSQDGKNISSLDSNSLLIDHLFSFFYDTKISHTHLDSSRITFKELDILNTSSTKIDSIDRFIKANKLSHQYNSLFRNASARMQIPDFETDQYLTNCLAKSVKFYVIYQHLSDQTKHRDEELSSLKFFRIKNTSINPIRFAVSIDKTAVENFVNYVERIQIQAEENQKKILEIQRIKEAKSQPLVYHSLPKHKTPKPHASQTTHRFENKLAKFQTSTKSTLKSPATLKIPLKNSDSHRILHHPQLPKAKNSDDSSIDSTKLELPKRFISDNLALKSSIETVDQSISFPDDHYTREFNGSIVINLIKANSILKNYLEDLPEKDDFLELLSANIDSFVNFFSRNDLCKIDKNLKQEIDELCQILESQELSKNYYKTIDHLGFLQSQIDLALLGFANHPSMITPKPSLTSAQDKKPIVFLSPDQISKKFVR